MQESKESFRQWCVVELFGHQKIAGLVSEFQIAGGSLVRVDVPALEAVPPTTMQQDGDGYITRYAQAEKPAMPAFTKMYGLGAIYGISPCSEETARAMAAQIRVTPIDVFSVSDWMQMVASNNRAKLPDRSGHDDFDPTRD